MAEKKVRKKIPKELAIINADNCTGCEACLEVCPVDCIFQIKNGVTQWCEIDLSTCIGCEQCIHVPGGKGKIYDVLVCPWDAIEMVPTEEIAQAQAKMGGPPEYIEENWERLVDIAQGIAELKGNKK
jgi:electron transport complex protein RnfB